MVHLLATVLSSIAGNKWKACIPHIMPVVSMLAAYPQGIEPRLAVLETAVLPLDQGYISMKVISSQGHSQYKIIDGILFTFI